MAFSVVMLSWEFPPRIIGGLAAHVHDLSVELAKKGVEVHVLTPDFPGAPKREEMNGVQVHRVDSYKYPAPDFASWIAMMNVNMLDYACGILKNELQKPFIIHAHDWLVAQASITLKHIFRMPLIATIHSTEYGRRGGIHDDYQRMIASTEAWLAREAWRVICVSRFLAEEVNRALGTPMGKIDVIPNGVCLENFSSSGSNSELRSRFAAPHERIVLYVGRLVYEKGVHLLVEAIPRVLQSVDVKFVIVGEGYLKEWIRRRVEEMGVAHKVYVTGFLDVKTVRSLYAVSDVFVMPSLYEPFGIVALEAAASRLPLVSTCIGGIGEIVSHLHSCVSVYPNPDSLAWGITQVLTNPALAEHLRTNAYERVKNEFTWWRIAERTIEVYQGVLGEYAAISGWKPRV
ncbi:MAG: glycosyltransferase family 4 protein [Nitrososphaerota archaeon]|nr:glycosyltransferase family 4 protein [Candidatus Calditenuaceae archaeon]MDW8073286.1 glycosyltransferase family 4 protein [Nitrososphaerota archaeon]